MSIQSNRAQIDGSLNVDGSIYQWNELFIGGGGGGGGDVAWSSGDVGLNNEVITAVGDGSINAEQYLTFDDANGLKIKGGKDLKLLAATDSSDAGDIIWEYDDGAGEWARLWSSQPSGDLYYRNQPDGLASRLVYHSGNLFISGNTNNNLVTASGGDGIYGESWLTADFTTKLLSIDGCIYTTGDIEMESASAQINLGTGSNGGPHGLNFYDDDNTIGLSLVYRTAPEELLLEDSAGEDLISFNKAGDVSVGGGVIQGNWEMRYNSIADTLDFNYIG